VNLMLNATDVISGVGSTYYRINGNAWTVATNILLIEDGVYIIDYYSVDMVGNIEGV